MREIALETRLFELVGARASALRRLEKLGIRTVEDLLWHFPSRYEDFSKIYDIADLEPGQQATIRGTIDEVNMRRSWRRGMTIVEASISDETGSIRGVWFNQPYLANILKTGRMANLAGKVSISDEGELYLNNPMHEVIRPAAGFAESGTEQETRHTGRLVPIYPETRGLTSRGIRFIMQAIFKRPIAIREWIPDRVLEKLNLPNITDAIRSIHFPRRIEDANQAQRRFSFEDLFLLQIANVRQKSKIAGLKSPPMKIDIERIKSIIEKLPFTLTLSQKKSLWEIIQDLEKPQPMNRLLQGDVGSGKTVVSAIAAMIAAENNYQTAFMAPTEILARQHFETMKKIFAFVAPENQPVIALMTSGSALMFYQNDLEAKISKPDLQEKIADGTVSIVFGTHALIQKTVSFQSLGLVVIDEQHRFGVGQRAALAGRKKTEIPHFLSMSATPIPRTLMLSVFGDLDLSLITELPGGRKKIETKIITPLERNATYDFIRTEVKNGRQAFVICPRIEPDSDVEQTKKTPGRLQHEVKKWELKSVKEEFEKLSRQIFPDLRITMLHGQMKAKEKEEIMKKFRAGESDILVATSVVEVGVDVPNATIMMIEGADRFGLAQLYQFRGRVGRGEDQSYCFLMSESTGKLANDRLNAVAHAKNGFELAEKDLEMRGPGQFFGNVQTGLPDIAMEGLRNPELVQQSRDSAEKIIAESPTLAKYPALKARLQFFEKRLHQE